jgi:hypothetical protein
MQHAYLPVFLVQERGNWLIDRFHTKLSAVQLSFKNTLFEMGVPMGLYGVLWRFIEPYATKRLFHYRTLMNLGC